MHYLHYSVGKWCLLCPFYFEANGLKICEKRLDNLGFLKKKKKPRKYTCLSPFPFDFSSEKISFGYYSLNNVKLVKMHRHTSSLVIFSRFRALGVFSAP